MVKRIKMIDTCYTNFGLKHTSKSQNTLPDDIRFLNYIVMTPKEKMNRPINSSLKGGTLVHEVVQKTLCKNIALEQVVKEFQDKANHDKLINEEKNKKKYDCIVENLKLISNNHLENLKALPKQEWEAEKEFTHWDNEGRIGTYFLCYVDLVGAAVDVAMSHYFGDIKNVFGTLLKTKKGYSYTKKKCPTKPFHSDLLQMALYSQCLPNHKPFLTYASDSDKVLFTSDNCDELQPDNLKKFYNELVLYQRCWEKKLEFANGDPKVLALLCKPDFSEMRKEGFWWQGIDPDIKQRFRSYYG